MTYAAAMPMCAEIVRDFKDEFGDGVKCVFASENGREVITQAWREECAREEANAVIRANHLADQETFVRKLAA